MRITIINGSPRKQGNTAAMCAAFAEGIRSADAAAEVETIHLYDYHYTGCRSCFACKRRGAPTYGRCIVRDDLTPLLERTITSDAVVFASPVYFMDVTGAMRSFIERLLFPLATYEAGYRVLTPKRMPTVTIYTMNVPAEALPEGALTGFEAALAHVFTHPSRLCACNTYQFDDYSRYAVEIFSEADKRRHRDEVFPQELEAARSLGRQTVAEIIRSGAPA